MDAGNSASVAFAMLTQIQSNASPVNEQFLTVENTRNLKTKPFRRLGYANSQVNTAAVLATCFPVMNVYLKCIFKKCARSSVCRRASDITPQFSVLFMYEPLSILH